MKLDNFESLMTYHLMPFGRNFQILANSQFFKVLFFGKKQLQPKPKFWPNTQKLAKVPIFPNSVKVPNVLNIPLHQIVFVKRNYLFYRLFIFLCVVGGDYRNEIRKTFIQTKVYERIHEHSESIVHGKRQIAKTVCHFLDWLLSFIVI